MVTTKTISQVFQRPVIERYQIGKFPISIIYAIANQPWTKASPDAAAVRIAMTVARAGKRSGVLHSVVHESDLETDEPKLVYAAEHGIINSDLTVGPDVTQAVELKANKGLCSPGVKLHGAGFIVTPAQAKSLGLGHEAGLEKHIRPYRNGRDLTSRSRNVMVIDFFGLSAEEARRKHPATYQLVLERVKPERDTNNRPYRRDNWWLFGENNPQWRKSLEGLSRYIVTPETAKHRFFVFFDASILPDNMITTIATDDAYLLAICSSRTHIVWSLRAGGRQGAGNDPRYTKTRTFDPFPFPDADETIQAELRAAGEELDATRKKVQADNPDLTLTEIYNVLVKVKKGTALTNAEEDVKRRGLVLVLSELNGRIDRLTAQAYGWSADLTDNQILEGLVALNAERAKEEAAGHVRWLRPEYQVQRWGKGASVKTGELDLRDTIRSKSLPLLPTDRYEQPLAIEAMLLDAGRPMNAAELARGFKRGGKRIESRIAQVLTTLARYGRVTPVEDGKYAASRGA